MNEDALDQRSAAIKGGLVLVGLVVALSVAWSVVFGGTDHCELAQLAVIGDIPTGYTDWGDCTVSDLGDGSYMVLGSVADSWSGRPDIHYRVVMREDADGEWVGRVEALN